MNPRETMRIFPAIFQPFLTWVTGAPLVGDKRFFSHNPGFVALLGAVQCAIGMSFAYEILQAGLSSWEWVAGVPMLCIASAITAGGMRRLDVLLIHQSLHGMVTKTRTGDRIVGEILTTLMVRVPYDINRREHLSHHANPCSLEDQDAVMLKSYGLRAGLSKAEFLRIFYGTLFSPAMHARFWWSRVKANFVGPMPFFRRVMVLIYWGTMIFCAIRFDVVVEWLILWMLPMSLFFQIATFTYTATEHMWYRHDHRSGLTRQQKDELSYARFCGDSVPINDAGRVSTSPLAWLRWLSRLFLLHIPYRVCILVGDTVQHDLHHARPSCDWPNSAYERQCDIDSGSTRLQEVWGSVFEHLYASASVRLT